MNYTVPNWTDPITWCIALALFVLLITQGWLTLRNRTLSPGRKTLRATLNGLLWLVVTGYILQINWLVDRPATHALLIGKDIPAMYAQAIQDSLRIRDRFTTGTFDRVYDSVTLVGQDFPTETLTRLSQSAVRWIPYDQPGQIQELRWKAIVRQGEMQRVTGRIHAQTRQLLSLRYGNQTLDSLMLTRGDNTFTMQFPVFGRGRIQTEIVVGGQPLDTVRFYSRPTTPLLVRFVLNNPDFESKTLADWLGKQGHSVQLTTTLAKNVRSNTGVNSSSEVIGRKPDIVITDPANAANRVVRNAVAGGKTVLFINLSNPPTDVTAINRALGTRWQIRKSANQETVPVSNGLTAHPYQFRNALNQFAVPGYPVAMQQGAGRVSVSLLNETFPLSLSGDSLGYSRIWYAILARLQPADKNSVLVDAPVLSGLPNQLYINNPSVSSSTLRVATDTVRLRSSPLNRQSAMGAVLTTQVGWQPVQDSLAVYIETITNNPAAARQITSRFMLAHSKYRAVRPELNRQASDKVPNWAWLTLFLLCLTALWVEPKFT